jgi:uroporphyrin-III C-methyltransferase/precorrin-2 dehydrogenase/sirohydrochlorin ferrochelatase
VYPVFLRMTGRRVLVVGAGQVAARRVRALLNEGADVQVVAPEVAGGFPCEVQKRGFERGDLDGVWLVQACATPEVNAAVTVAAQAAGIWCVNASDASGPAWTGSRLEAGDVQVAVCGGGDPGRARTVLAAIEEALGSADLRATREHAGRVALVGAGPGDPELLTVRARNLLAAADVVVTDRLAPRAALDLTHGRVIHVGKAPGEHTVGQDGINAILVEQARAGKAVVRLKGGDPFVLGRGGEELQACLDAGIEVEVVPGITSAVAVPAAAGIPVTHRGLATGFVVATAHGQDPALVAHLAAIPPEITIVLLMGVRALPMVVAALLRGRRPDTPAAIVERGWTLEQRTVTATLATLVEVSEGVRAPSIVVVGEVAALHAQFGDVGRVSAGAGLVADG